MAENIYHLESKRVENLVFSQEIGGENGIFTKKRQVEILVFFKKVQSRWRKWSKIEVEKTVFFYQVEKMGSPRTKVYFQGPYI